MFEGLREGDEAALHTMASGASVGLGLNSSVASDSFLSERSVIKLAASERPRLVAESEVTGGNKKVHLRKVVAPNTIVEGENAGGKLDIREALVRGSISASGELDSYRFAAKAGDFVSAEFNGFDVPVGDPVIGAIQLYFVEPEGGLTLVAENFQNFEGFDAFLVDAAISQNGDYVLQVSAPDIISLGIPSDGDGQPFLLSLDSIGLGHFRIGDYNLSIYVITGKSGQGPGAVPGA